MRTGILAFLTVVGYAAAQGVPESIAPSNAPPAGCHENYQGNFEVQVIQPMNKRDVSKKQKRADCSAQGVLFAGLQGGVMTDSRNRTGYIASNYQLQFDAPPQAGAIYTAGFSVCQDDVLALGGSRYWWACVSGSFYNIYDRDWADQCSEVQIEVLRCEGRGSNSQVMKEEDSAASGEITNEQVGEGEELMEENNPKEEQEPQGEEKPVERPQDTEWPEEQPKQTPAPPAVVSTTSRKICQIVDGQIQAHDDECEQPEQTAAPQAGRQSPDETAAPQAVPSTTSRKVCQIVDGQIQAHDGECEQPEQTAAPQAVSQSPDETAAPQAVSQSTDRPIEATNAPQSVSKQTPDETSAPKVVGQSTDGQIVATTSPQSVNEPQPEGTQSPTESPQQTVAPQVVSQSSDGQIEQTAAPQPVSQSSDSQIEQAATSQAVSENNQSQVEQTAATAPQSVATAPINQIDDGQVQATFMVSAGPQPVELTTKQEKSATTQQTTTQTAPAAPAGLSQSTDGQVGATSVQSEASASPQSAPLETSSYGVNWGSRSVTASVTPAWLGASGAMFSSAQKNCRLDFAAVGFGVLGTVFLLW